MRLPNLEGIVERRLLVNYRVDPEVAARLLPAPFEPQLVSGWAVAGICLIRLGQLRPRGLPGIVGVRSENAAHRIAVTWPGADGASVGVYIPRRDTGAATNALVGGRLFPGYHHRARFHVNESSHDLRVGFDSVDGSASVDVVVATGGEFDSRLFHDLDTASRFFQRGSVGYSATRSRDRFDGLELRTDAWRVETTKIVSVRSSFFDDPELFPQGAATIDCALLMRDVPVTWHARGALRATASEPILSVCGEGGVVHE